MMQLLLCVVLIGACDEDNPKYKSKFEECFTRYSSPTEQYHCVLLKKEGWMR